MMAFMAGHLGLPAKCVKERENKCKSERQHRDQLRSHNSCRSALRGRGIIFWFVAATRRKSIRLVQGRITAWVAGATHTSRARKDEEPTQPATDASRKMI
jgi:hypothetical protein